MKELLSIVIFTSRNYRLVIPSLYPRHQCGIGTESFNSLSRLINLICPGLQLLFDPFSRETDNMTTEFYYSSIKIYSVVSKYYAIFVYFIRVFYWFVICICILMTLNCFNVSSLNGVSRNGIGNERNLVNTNL